MNVNDIDWTEYRCPECGVETRRAAYSGDTDHPCGHCGYEDPRPIEELEASNV